MSNEEKTQDIHEICLENARLIQKINRYEKQIIDLQKRNSELVERNRYLEQIECQEMTLEKEEVE